MFTVNKRLALNSDGNMTYCTAPIDKIGVGRCNHVEHQQNNEPTKDFVDRVSRSNLGVSSSPARLNKGRLKELSGAGYGQLMKTPGVEYQIKEINEIGFDTNHINQDEFIPGEKETEYFSHSGDSVTYSGRNIVKIHLDSLYDDSDDIEVSDYGDRIEIDSRRPLKFTSQQINMIDKYGGASMDRGMFTIGGKNAKPFNKEEAIKIDDAIIKKNKY